MIRGMVNGPWRILPRITESLSSCDVNLTTYCLTERLPLGGWLNPEGSKLSSMLSYTSASLGVVFCLFKLLNLLRGNCGSASSVSDSELLGVEALCSSFSCNRLMWHLFSTLILFLFRQVTVSNILASNQLSQAPLCNLVLVASLNGSKFKFQFSFQTSVGFSHWEIGLWNHKS